MRILDTSVIYKWYVEEEDTAKALLLRDDFVRRGVETVIPDFLFLELSNALRYNPKMEQEDVEDIVDNLFELGLETVVTTPTLTKEALRIAYDYQITVYDALYLALAQNLEFEFITADKKLYEKTKTLYLAKYLGDIKIF
jgi:predicted nucleic acid-binding protein